MRHQVAKQIERLQAQQTTRSTNNQKKHNAEVKILNQIKGVSYLLMFCFN